MTTVATTSVVFQGCLEPVVAVSPASAGWGTWDTGARNVAALGARGVNASKFPAVASSQPLRRTRPARGCFPKSVRRAPVPRFSRW